MRTSSFWPPARTRHRIAAEVYRRRNPDQPWLTRNAIAVLSDLLKSDDRVLEWGAGSSTAWLGRRVKRVHSIEHDPIWFERVGAELRRGGLDSTQVRLLSTEPTHEPAASPYVRVVDEFGDAELELAFLDGEHRAACALAVLPKLAPGGLLLLDDAHGYIDHPTASPHSRHGLGSLDTEWTKFGEAVRGWRSIWTSDGFSDTAIWIKP